MAKSQKRQPQQLPVFVPQTPVAWTDKCPRCGENAGQTNLEKCAGCGMEVCSGCMSWRQPTLCLDCAG